MLPRLIPVLLIENGGLIKTQKFSSPVYLGDPTNALKIFNEKEVDEVIVIDRSAIDGPNFELLELMAVQAFMPLAYGGGVKTFEQASRLFSIGFEKVVFTTALKEDPALVKRVVERYGAQAVVGGIDIKKSFFRSAGAVINKGKEATGWTPQAAVQVAQGLGVGEIFLQDIDTDGVMKGYNLKLIEEVTKLVEVPLIVCGGASGMEDFRSAVKAGASAVAAGSYFVFMDGDRHAILINYPPYADVRELFNR